MIGFFKKRLLNIGLSEMHNYKNYFCFYAYTIKVKFKLNLNFSLCMFCVR